MGGRGELQTLMRTARQLAALCQDASRLVDQARGGPPLVVSAAREMHSRLLRTKHAVETSSWR